MNCHTRYAKKLSLQMGWAGLVMLISAPLSAASFKGKVLLPDNQPAAGAMVTVMSADKKTRQTVYSNDQGQYAIVTPYTALAPAKLTLRARLANYADGMVEVSAQATDFRQLDLRLSTFADAQKATEALPASSHNARLAWKDPADRAAFISQCNYCHQFGNSTTRLPRSHEGWMETIRRMEGYLAMVTPSQKQNFAETFSQGFDGKPISSKIFYGASDELAKAKVEEWLIGEPTSFIHDMDIMSDGLFYGTDEGHDRLEILDPNNGAIESLALPSTSLPRGGKFSGMELNIGIFTGSHGPHSMGQTSDGNIWITASLSSSLIRFNPKTRQFKVYPVPGDALYPHTLRVDQHDIVWFTIVASNQMGRFDPRTETMTVMRLPHNGFFRWLSDMLFPTLLRISSWFPDRSLMLNFTHHRFLGYSVLAFPYGIDINPKDGSVWYAKLYANKIGRIDPKTMEVVEYDTPLPGPRRPRFDAKGIFWIPAFDAGALMRFDPQNRQFKTWKIPGVGENQYETPYALNVDKKTGEVWMAANNSDRVIRFRPDEEIFMSYPSPTRVTFLRDFVFDTRGRVCSSQSNLPAWAIEDQRPSYICFDPAGGAQDGQNLRNR